MSSAAAPRVVWLSIAFLLGLALLPAMGQDADPPPDCPDLVADLSPFAKLASTPSRLTLFNAHDDARQGAYNCSQEREVVEAAIKQTRAFLTLNPDSDYSDNSLFHLVRIASQGDNFRLQVEALQDLIARFPTSDLADDALYKLATMVGSDAEATGLDRVALLETLVGQFPASVHGARALALLAESYRERQNYEGAAQVTRQLLARFPYADECPGALLATANRFRDSGLPEQAVAAYRELLDLYPYSDEADDALFQMAETYRAERQTGPAMSTYEALLRDFPASSHAPAARRELETARPGAYATDEPCPCEIAPTVFKTAREHQNMRRFQAAIEGYLAILRDFRGCNCYDDALFQIGRCYEELDLLGMALTQAHGREDLFSRQAEWRDATGLAAIPEGEIAATKDAVSAYLLLANSFVGSPLRDDALHRIHELFKERKDKETEAMVCQEILVRFPGSEFECEALHAVIDWYANDAKFPQCIEAYRQLAAAWPGIFPDEITVSEDEFRGMMRYYAQATELGYQEAKKKHIGYDYGVAELQDDAAYYLGNVQISYGRTEAGIRTLSQLAARPHSDQAAYAYFCAARASERIGDLKTAIGLYQRLIDEKPLSGLADDAQARLDAIASGEGDEDVSELAAQVEKVVGKPVTTYDVYAGQHVVVFCPFSYTAVMRAYNLPNIWDTAQASLAAWTGEKAALEKRQTIVMDTAPGAQSGEIIRLPVSALADPPQWDVGLAQLAANFLDDAHMDLLRRMGEPMVQAFVRLAAANLQYELVSETRDTIGNASAVKLPFENLVRQREAAAAALDAYIRDGANPEARNADVTLGMLLALLDTTGNGNSGLVDWTPYRRFFQAMRASEPLPADAGERDCAAVFVSCMGKAFNTNLVGRFREWGFDVRG